MPTPSYRVNLSFDAEHKVWKATAPELEHCAGEGATRAEAIAKLEEEIDAQVQNMLAQGSNPPTPLDETTLTGELQVKVSAALHRDLLWQARQEGVDVEHLMAEMLAAGVEARRGTRRDRPQNRPAHDPDSIGNSVGRDRGGRGFGARYNPQLLEDRANFIEYVRNLEHNGGVPGAAPSRGPGGAGGAGGGSGRPNNNDRRRGRGPRGPGGGQNAGGNGSGGRL